MRILLVEDSPITAELAKDALGVLGHEVETAASIDEAEVMIDLVLYDVVVLDLMVQGGSTYALAARLVAANQPFCVASAMNPALMKAPLCDAPTLQKPYSVCELIELIEHTASTLHSATENLSSAADSRGHIPDR